MKKVYYILLSAMLLIQACDKDGTKPNNNNNNNNPNSNACQDGYICHKLSGNSVSKAGSGYAFADTFCFVKYEDGPIQLSIDIFGKSTGAYTVGDIRQAGWARIYYFPENNVMYMSERGVLNVSEYTSDNKITGTFSGTLYRYDSNNNTFTYSDSLIMSEGSFRKIQLTL